MEPEYERCPYQAIIAPRILSVIAERTSENITPPNDDIYQEDWYRLYERDPGLEPIMLSRTNNPLYIDVTTNGAIFKLWNSIRLLPNEKNIDAMIKYLKIIERKFPIEEEYFYFDLYRKVTGTNHPLEINRKFYKALRYFFVSMAYKLQLGKLLRKLKMGWLADKLVNLFNKS